MKIAVNEGFGDVEKIKIVEATIPHISSGEVLVKVVAAGLNPNERNILQKKNQFI